MTQDKAIIWRLFFSPTTVALTGGFIALMSLGVFVWQNCLISKQNAFVQEQIKQQDDQYKLQRRTELIEILYGNAGIRNGSANIRIKKEALIEFVELERLERKLNKVDEQSQINLSKVRLQDIKLENVDLSDVNFEGANFQLATLIDVNFTNCNLREAIFVGTVLTKVKLKGALVSENMQEFNNYDIKISKETIEKYRVIDSGEKTTDDKTIYKLELKKDI